MAFVGWQFTRGSLTNIPAILIAAVSVILVFRYKVNSAWMVLGGALAGILLQLLKWT
jgi:chromate transporter